MRLLTLVALLVAGGAQAERPGIWAPGAATPVELYSVVLTLDRDRFEGKYLLENPTDAPVAVQLVLPRSPFPCTSNDCAPPPSLPPPVLKVLGAAVPVKSGTASPIWPGAKATWTATVTVPARGQRLVAHAGRAQVDYTESTMGQWLTDLLVPQAWHWSRPITLFRWVVRRERPWGIRFDAALELVELSEAPKQPTRIAFEARNLQPKRHFRLRFDGEPWLTHGTCAALLTGEVRGIEDTHARPDDPIDDRAALLRTILDRLDKAALRRCRNLPYALHGYPFKDATLRAAFYPRSRPGEIGFKLNPAWAPEILSADELRFIRAVKAAEKRR